MMKAVIFDSGALITLSMNSMLDIIRELKKKFNGKFLITKEVEYESVIRPMQIKKYKLGAMNIKALIDDKILEFPNVVGASEKEISLRTKELMNAANSVFQARDRNLHLIDVGETSCVALSSLLYHKNIQSVIVIDERTTRMLSEKPENLQQLMESKLHTKIMRLPLKDHAFRETEFIRSAELVYVAYKKGLVKNKSKDMLDAMLYGVKFKGCSISNEEIKEIEKL
ncbi:hypothetical protein J4466_03360 [Candidatus Pacearchaeota archaeon]|nr:hypothetical protein [Candidatus Pacearchaeota archaeon]